MACHCAYYAFSPSPPYKDFSIAKPSTRSKPFLLSSIANATRASFNTLVSQAVRHLVPPARFEASKLKVVLMGKEMNEYSGIIPRTYILSHCDFTANLTLTISNVINIDQLRGWYSKDDVVVEWKKIGGKLGLHIHCYVSGPNLMLDLAAELRYYIFSKEMPLVLEAVLHGDSVMLREHPELINALVWVYFHSSSPKYNRLECWGPLKDAAKGRQGDHFQLLPKSGEDKNPFSKLFLPFFFEVLCFGSMTLMANFNGQSLMKAQRIQNHQKPYCKSKTQN
ncbi:magnesium dechelatase SGRL, chloroplastic isoform X2 [Hevea brasiliensis]|uniref:magnesium dechelatase SGRL, chloroplastic isoform X2 n=1 Tax=Hevea brasiliensis TaxID=3981 RepID=UPI0025D8EB30|nr:magnesium dechelatase SGRL, chloroplastic isoform X2 [Hevea brasiliensis]